MRAAIDQSAADYLVEDMTEDYEIIQTLNK